MNILHYITFLTIICNISTEDCDNKNLKDEDKFTDIQLDVQKIAIAAPKGHVIYCMMCRGENGSFTVESGGVDHNKVELEIHAPCRLALYGKEDPQQVYIEKMMEEKKEVHYNLFSSGWRIIPSFYWTFMIMLMKIFI